jgi:hypothetical protein
MIMGLETNEIYFVLSALSVLGFLLILRKISDKQKQNKNVSSVALDSSINLLEPKPPDTV